MKISARAAGFTVVFLASTLPSFAQQVDAAQERTIKAQVNSAIDQYVQWFQAERPDLIAEKVYLSPSVRLTPTGPLVMASVDEIRKTWEGVLRPLVADGYTRSEWPTRNVCVLNEAAAVVSGHFIRYRKDGSVIGEYDATYTVAKTGDGWRTVAVVSHDAARALKCGP